MSNTIPKKDPSDHSTPFDHWQEGLRKIHAHGNTVGLADAAVIVNDTMKGAELICKEQFGDGNFKPEHVIKVLELILAERRGALSPIMPRSAVNTARRLPAAPKPNKHGPSPTLTPCQGTPSQIARALAEQLSVTPSLPAKAVGKESNLVRAANAYEKIEDPTDSYEAEGTFGQVLKWLFTVNNIFKGYGLQTLHDALEERWPSPVEEPIAAEQTPEDAPIEAAAPEQGSTELTDDRVDRAEAEAARK